MSKVRIWHRGETVVGIESRYDETYTEDNRPPDYLADTWIEADSRGLNDADGVIPMESLRVRTVDAKLTLTVDAAQKDSIRQDAKDRTRGAGGRVDVLEQRLADDTITDAEQRELLRLERGL